MSCNGKVAWWAHVVFVVLILTTIANGVGIYFVRHNNGGLVVMSVSFAVMTLCTIMLVPMWLNTYYVLEESQLLIVCGFFKLRIPYDSITSAKESCCPLSSFALSLDRILIKYKSTKGRNRIVLIAPVRKQEFLDTLNKLYEKGEQK